MTEINTLNLRDTMPLIAFGEWKETPHKNLDCPQCNEMMSISLIGGEIYGQCGKCKKVFQLVPKKKEGE